MRVRKISVLTLAVVAAGLSLAACDNGGTDSASPSSTSSSAATSAAHPSTSTAKTSQGSASATSSGTAKKSGVSCTNQIDYAGDSRSNAEINSIGEKTGYCPPVQH